MIHQGYEVWIADGHKNRFPEYDIQSGDDGKTITCFIPSESGKFSIQWKDHNGPAANATSMRAFVDGQYAGKTRCATGVSGKRLGMSTTSVSTYRPYQFANLRTSDDDDALQGAGAPDALGTIELRVVHVHAHARVVNFAPAAFEGVGVVHERSKKAGSHCVTLGAARPRKDRGHHVESIPLDKRAGPCATFVFRYRPAAILQAQGIMPLKEEIRPNRLGTSRASDSGIRDDEPVPFVKMRAGTASVKERKTSSIKPEPVHNVPVEDDVIVLSDSDDYASKVKREPGIQVKTHYDPDDVIDLTLD